MSTCEKLKINSPGIAKLIEKLPDSSRPGACIEKPKKQGTRLTPIAGSRSCENFTGLLLDR